MNYHEMTMILILLVGMILVFLKLMQIRQSILSGNIKYTDSSSSWWNPFVTCMSGKSLTKHQESMDPGLANVSPADEQMNLASLYDPVTLQSTTIIHLPIQNYCIKASYNSACSGYNVSTNTLVWILSRGCRYLDFEVHAITDADKNTLIIVKFVNSSNFILLSDVLSTIMNHAFQNTSPNPQDPLFLNLRIYQDNNPLTYSLISMSIQNIIGPKLFKGPVSGNTFFYLLRNKIVLSCDQTINPHFLDLMYYPGCTENDISNSTINTTTTTTTTSNTTTPSTTFTPSLSTQLPSNQSTLSTPSSTTKISTNCYDLANLINIQSGDKYLSIFTEQSMSTLQKNPPTPYIPPKVDISQSMILPSTGKISSTSTISTSNQDICNNMLYNVTSWRIVQPTNPISVYNTNPFQMIANYGAQIIPCKFYKVDQQLRLYETFFNEQHAAFVPLAMAIPYATDSKRHLIQETTPQLTI
jgi:Phosphatidylinositol-specific phospholipase C, X domain